MKRFFLCLFVLIVGLSTSFAKEIKVLAIGNSFSQDAVEQYLYEIAASNGDTILIGNMYIGGCSLPRHYHNAMNNTADYTYAKIKNGEKTITEHTTLHTALQDEEWDYITFQQVSQDSGIFDTYFPYLTDLSCYARRTAANPRVTFALHATWAYATDSTHGGFVNYDKNQTKMFRAIVDTYDRVSKISGISVIIPAGTAIQNARSSSLGDTFTRDGYHLQLDYGRYTAACTWYEKLFGKTVKGTSYRPENVTLFQAEVAQEAAHQAVLNPGVITLLGCMGEE